MTLKIYKVSVFMALAFYAQSSSAEVTSPMYVGMSIGNTAIEDTAYSRKTVVTTINSTGVNDVNVEMDNHASQTLTLGYRVNHSVSLEVEYARHRNSAKELTTKNGLIIIGTDAETRSDNLMFNTKYTIFNESAVRPFIGLGVGTAKIGAKITDTHGSSEDTNWRFAYQALAGIEIPIKNQISLVVAYQYFKIPDANIEVIRPQSTATTNYWKVDDYAAKTVYVGLQYHF